MVAGNTIPTCFPQITLQNLKKLIVTGHTQMEKRFPQSYQMLTENPEKLVRLKGKPVSTASIGKRILLNTDFIALIGKLQ